MSFLRSLFVNNILPGCNDNRWGRSLYSYRSAQEVSSWRYLNRRSYWCSRYSSLVNKSLQGRKINWLLRIEKLLLHQSFEPLDHFDNGFIEVWKLAFLIADSASILVRSLCNLKVIENAKTLDFHDFVPLFLSKLVWSSED